MPERHMKALKLAQNGQWEAAHSVVQTHSDAFSCLIHAYLHRVEGDNTNAAYWYQRAGEAVCTLRLEDELESLFSRVP